MSLCKLVMTHVIRVNLRHSRATRVATVNGGTPNFLGELVVYGSRLAKDGLFTVGRWSANGLTVYGVLYMTILRAKEREAADNLKNLSAKVDELKTREQFNSEKLDALIFNVKPIGDDVKGIREDLKAVKDAVKDAVHKSSSSDS